jgi:hypothetical protein
VFAVGECVLGAAKTELVGVGEEGVADAAEELINLV